MERKSSWVRIKEKFKKVGTKSEPSASIIDLATNTELTVFTHYVVSCFFNKL